jgi:hypothetical protein
LTGLSEKLSEVASRDVVYLSLKQVTPRRRARPAKETLLSIEPALSIEHHRFSLHVDRRTKRGNHSFLFFNIRYGDGQFILKLAIIFPSCFQFCVVCR